jgi:hypothetical protein
MTTAKPKDPPKVISIKEVAETAPITTLLAKPKHLQPDHYLLETIVKLWKQNKISTEDLDSAYLNVDEAAALLVRVSRT